jgi:uncharacterized RmlC-like cupin family protein
VAPAPVIISSLNGDVGGQAVRGATLAIEDWATDGVANEVAPLHVHHADDEAWHVVSGALRFRFEDQELIARSGTTVLVPAGVPHTFGDAGLGPSRFIIILHARMDRLISRLHRTDTAEHPPIYREFDSELLE